MSDQTPPVPPLPSTVPQTAEGGPKPTRPYTVEHNLHVPLEQEDGSFKEIVLPLRIGFRKMQDLMAKAREERTDAIGQLFMVMDMYGISHDPIEGAADYADVLAVAQYFMDAFQEKALTKLGEFSGSSPD